MSAATHPDRQAPEEPGKPRWRQVLRRFPELAEGLRLLWRAAPGWSLANAAVLLLEGVVPLVGLLLLKRVVDTLTAALAAPEPALREPLFYAALVGAVALVGALLQALSSLIGEAQGQLLTDHLQGRIHARSVELDLAYFENPEYYDHLHRAQQEGFFRPARIAAGLAQLARGVVALVAVAGLLIVLNPWIVVIVVALSLPGLAVKLKYSEELYLWRRDRTATERLALMIDRMLTQVRFAKEVRLFGLGEHLARRHQELRRILRRERLALARKRAAADLGTQGGGTVAVFGALVFIVLQAARGEITLGDLVMYFGALQRALATTQQLLGAVANLYEDSLYLAYLRGFLELEPRVTDPPEPLPVAPLSRGIVFEDVSFAYPGRNLEVLRGVSLELRAGEVTALVGENGAGKTTLVKLLCRLYDPDSGRIQWDGDDLRRLAAGELRRRIAVAFQDFAQFPATVGENIAYGDVERPRDDAAVAAAARVAGAEGAIAALPGGYGTPLGKWFLGGQELSLGQWQKIALARAFYRRDAELVVLDEPTAGLDALAEAELFASFRRLIAGRTALLISHRFSSVRMADRIYVLAEGRVVESGSHRELVRLDGLYAKMFNVQARMYRLDGPRVSG